jgi:hypothetical protein
LDPGSRQLRPHHPGHRPNCRRYSFPFSIFICSLIVIFILNSTGGCPANLGAVNNDTNRCWWTCSGCSRPSDITTCPDKNTWGLTYDDGPSPYTTQLLDFLDANNLKATFFVVGSRCISLPAILQAEYMAGHQIAAHTWSHPSLTTLTNEQIIAELGWSRKIIRDVLGVSPNMMRPPFGDIEYVTLFHRPPCLTLCLLAIVCATSPLLWA